MLTFKPFSLQLPLTRWLKRFFLRKVTLAHSRMLEATHIHCTYTAHALHAHTRVISYHIPSHHIAVVNAPQFWDTMVIPFEFAISSLCMFFTFYYSSSPLEASFGDTSIQLSLFCSSLRNFLPIFFLRKKNSRLFRKVQNDRGAVTRVWRRLLLFLIFHCWGVSLYSFRVSYYSFYRFQQGLVLLFECR